MKCVNCGANLANGVSFCRECGTKVNLNTSYCTECGTPLEPGTKYCTECGNYIGAHSTPNRTRPEIKATQTNESSNFGQTKFAAVEEEKPIIANFKNIVKESGLIENAKGVFDASIMVAGNLYKEAKKAMPSTPEVKHTIYNAEGNSINSAVNNHANNEESNSVDNIEKEINRIAVKINSINIKPEDCEYSRIHVADTNNENEESQKKSEDFETPEMQIQRINEKIKKERRKIRLRLLCMILISIVLFFIIGLITSK